MPEGRLQYSLGTLMLLITASAVFLGMCQWCGVGMRPAVFAIGFCVFMMFPGVAGRPPRIVVRSEDADEARKLLARRSPPVDD